MPDGPVITNTSPLLYLHQADCLQILKELYGSVTVPMAVQNELEEGIRKGVDVPDMRSIEWVRLQRVSSPVLVPEIVGLGPGEAEVIALGLEMPSSLLILDDQFARRTADLYGIRYTGTLGVLVRAKQTGLIPSVAGIVTALRTKGMWLSDTIVAETLRLAGEES